MSDNNTTTVAGTTKNVWGFAVRVVEGLGLPRLIISCFLLLLFIAAFAMKMDIANLMSDSLVRIGMNGILVLAMLPTIACGVGLNFGLPVGVICGLIGGVLSMNMELQGITGFAVALTFAVPLAIIAGYLYARLLDKVQGQEMMVGTYVGFSIVSLMGIFWLTAPIRNPGMIFAIGGQGLRYTLTLENHFGKVLNNFARFTLPGTGLIVPTGLLLFFAAFCIILYFFFRSRAGLALLAVGSNPQYASSSGINVKAMRFSGVILSTVLGAIGILVYAQSYGFLQLYNAPLYMAFPAVAAVLIGGATLRRATLGHAIIGSVLFFTLLTIALPVTQTALSGADVSEIARMIIQNGMILYALTRVVRR